MLKLLRQTVEISLERYFYIFSPFFIVKIVQIKKYGKLCNGESETSKSQLNVFKLHVHGVSIK